MRKKIRTIVFTIVFVLLISMNTLAQDDNLITNWEFDDGIESWQFWDGGENADALYELDDQGMLSGDYSIRWDIVDGGTELWYLQTYQTIPVWQDIEYFIDFMIAWEGPDSLNLSFVWELAVDPYDKYLYVDTVLYDFNQHVKYSFIAGATDEAANFKIFVGRNVDAIVWLDRVYVSDVPLEDAAVREQPEFVPEAFSLEQNYPNPFNATTTFYYNLPEREAVTIQILDVNGRIVREFALGIRSAGRHSYKFDAYALSSGLYFYRAKTSSGLTPIKRCLLLK